MRKFFSFWRRCAKIAAKDSASFANDWQWVFGVPACTGVAASVASYRGGTELSTGNPIVDGFLAALAAFIITWLLAFIVRTLNAASRLYDEEKKRADDAEQSLVPKISVSLDPLCAGIRVVRTRTPTGERGPDSKWI